LIGQNQNSKDDHDENKKGFYNTKKVNQAKQSTMGNAECKIRKQKKRKSLVKESGEKKFENRK
jgi:hypothetical protein